jgi:biopolymer transport protein ExbB
MNHSFGIAHFYAQADAMAISLLVVLLIMSIGTWAIAIQSIHTSWRNHQHAKSLLNNERTQALEAKDFKIPSIFSWAYHAYTHRSDSMDFVLDCCASRLDRGQILLATVAASAPFVGLLGTVWGIYHALTAVAVSGQANIEKMMGPVGETLLMTALGLLVALPAVVVYNLNTRSNAKCLLNIQAVLQRVQTPSTVNTQATTHA